MKTGMKAQAMRLSNTSLVLSTILASPSPVSRAQIAAQTDLTRATVSRLVDSLLQAEIIEELEPERSTPGRPSLPLRAHSGTCVAIGLDISIDRLTISVMDLAGNLIHEASATGTYENSDPELVMEALSALISEATIPPQSVIVGLTLSVPGIFTGTTILTAPNLGWKNVDVGPLLTLDESFPPLTLMNEADAAGYDVLYGRPGFIQSDDTFVYVSGGVGVGAALFLEGDLFGGRHSWAGELGHLCIDPRGPACRCGSNGCLEQYAGTKALLHAAGITPDGTVADLIDKVEQHDMTARQAIDDAAVSLGRGIASVVNLLDLDTIVVGGDLGSLYPYMERRLADELKYRVLGSRWSSIVLTPRAGEPFTAARGACLAAFTDLIDAPEALLNTAE